MLLKDKVAIITGSSRGIGRATAIEFAKQGAKVVVNYNKSKEEAEKVVEEITRLGTEAISIKADVSKPDEVKLMINKTLEKFGSINILVNNAGMVAPKP
ncbi:MAG: SDR family NAD(P)-dependent oxidoreductase, partial [Candidatus Aenigmarchaeota archaeon]|nr:SDR family NAD(P)-dependent oxidoreductase [Candidatus Aenigmarchaeota archaeon]